MFLLKFPEMKIDRNLCTTHTSCPHYYPKSEKSKALKLKDNEFILIFRKYGKVEEYL